MQKFADLGRMVCGGWAKKGIFLAILAFGVSDIARGQNSFSTALDLGMDERGTVNADNTGVTPDANAPNIAGFPPAHPVWFKWTAPHDGDVELDTIGSVDDLFFFYPLDTVLGIYQGTDVSHLNQLAANDDLFPVNSSLTSLRGSLVSPVTELAAFSTIFPPFYGPSHLRFTAKGGQTYYFAVDSKPSAFNLFTFVTTGNISLQWAYKSSGVFRFASEDVDSTTGLPLYQAAQTESLSPAGLATDVGSVEDTYYPYNAAGCLVTVTRSAGSKGRVTVDFQTVTGPDLPLGVPFNTSPAYLLYTNIFYFTNSLGALIASNSEVVPGDFTGITNTLVFDDFEMSKTVLIPINSSGTYLDNPNIVTVGIATSNSVPTPQQLLAAQTLARAKIANTLYNKVFGVMLSNPQKDVGESEDVSDPRVDPTFSTAIVKILNTTADPYGPDLVPDITSNIVVSLDTNIPPNLVTNVFFFTNLVIALNPTNVLFNFEKANYRVPADVADPANDFSWANVTLYVMRSGTNGAATTVNYRVNNYQADDISAAEGNNQFPLQPASDYAIPNPSRNPSVVRNYSDTNWDFDVADGTLSFPATGAGARYQPIHIQIPVRKNTRFNKDFRIQLWRSQQIGGETIARLVGMVSETTVTVLFNDETPPAGSVDEFYNADFDTEMATMPSKRPVTNPSDNSNPGVGSPFFPGQVYSIAVLTNNEALIGGAFFTYNGWNRNGVALVQTNGQLDFSLDPGSGISGDISQQGNDSAVNAVATVGNKFYIAGNFSSYNGTLVGGIARLNADGSLDSSFTNGLGANGTIRALQTLNDGRVLVGGEFTEINGVTRNYIARLNADGSVDESFNPTNIINGPVYALAVAPNQTINVNRTATGTDPEDDQPINLGTANAGVLTVNYDMQGVPDDMRVYYGGTNGFLIFETQSNGVPGATNGIGQVILPFGPINGFSTNVITIVMNQGGGILGTAWSYTASVTTGGSSSEIVVGGKFTVTGQVYQNIAKLKSDGSLDTAFNPGTGTSDRVRALSWQGDDKILAGGEFNTVNGLSYNHIVRFNPDGSIDTTNFFIGTGADDVVYCINSQADGIYIGGRFESVNGTLRRGIARLYYDGTVDTTFLDTAYNQFAGLKKIYASDTPAVFACATDNGGVLIGGSFFQVGGGQASADVANAMDAQLFIPDSFDGANLWVEPKARNGFRNRTSFARLIGGSTPGPGNLSLNASAYSQNKSQSTLNIGLVRTNGTLGPASANFIVQPGTALAGQDYRYQSAPPLYWIAWNYLTAPTRMREDGLWGISGNVVDTLGTFLPLSDAMINSLSKVTVSIIKNNLNPGDLNAQFQLANPNLDSFFLGGQEIPLGVALGVSKAPFTLIDDTTSPGQFGFKSAEFVATNLSPAITIVRSNGTFGQVSMFYSTTNGTALATVDYAGLTNRQLVFPNQVISNGFNVTILNNGSISPVEKSFGVRMFNLGTTPGATYGITNAKVRIINPSFQGFVTLSASNYTGNVSAGVLNFTVTRVAGSLGQITVDYQTTNGTAVNGVDFTGVTNRLTWASGDVASRTISVPLLPNQTVGGIKQFGVRLYAPTLNSVTNFAVMGIISNATCTISNDNSYGLLQFNTSFYSVNEGTNNYATVTVVRIGGAAGTVSANFTTGDGSNTVAGVNYFATNGVLVFTNGQTVRSFRVYLKPDGIADPVPTNFYFNVTLFNPTNATFGSPTNAQVRILDAESFNRSPGSADTGFTTDGMDGDVLALALNSSGQIIAGGNFTSVGTTERGRIARLNSNGDLDNGFLAGLSGANAAVNAVVCQSDDRILVGGAFTTLNDVNRSFIGRLMIDGSLDTSFNPGAGADSAVNAIAEAFSGTGTNQVRKIYIGGAFSSINGISSPGVERLNNDGSVDLGFNVGAGADGPVYAIAVYPTNSPYWGKVLVGGSFSHFSGVTVSNLVRLNIDGSLDTNFVTNLGSAADAAVHALAIQLDGKILVGGSFTSFNATDASYITRLNADGTLDTSFTCSGANSTVEAIALSTANRILVSGQFTTFNGVTRNHITRLQPDGATDTTINFGSGANGDVDAIVIQPTDDAVVIGGAFSQYNGAAHSRIARIYGGSVTGSGAFEFTSANFQAHESGILAAITVRRTGGTAGPNPDGSGNLSVHFMTSDGTAKNGTNYQAVSTDVIFPPGETIETVLVPVLRDFVITSNLIANLSLTNAASPAVLGNQPTAVLTIINDDNAIAFASPTYTQVKNAPTHMAVIDVARIGGANDTATVDFSTTTNGTAVIGTDYFPTNKTIIFNPGVTNVQVQIPIINNGLPQGNRTVGLSLTNVFNSNLTAPSNAVLTIIDTVSAPGQLFFAATNFFASSGDAQATLFVFRTNGAAGAVSVSYNTVAGTAQAGVDYSTSSGSVTFGSGEVAKPITIPLINNPVVHPPVSFAVVLSNPTGGASLRDPSAANVTIASTNVGFAFLNATNYVRETNGTVPIFVQRIGGLTGNVSVNFATTNNGTAVAGINYTPDSGILAFTTNETLKAISLPLIYDPRVMGDLTLGIRLFNPSSGAAVVAPSNAVVVVQDANAGLSFTNDVMNVNKNVGNVVITVVCSNPSVEPVIVDSNTVPMAVSYSTVNGTAVAGVDYTAVTGTLIFTNGIGTNTFNVPIINNSLVTGDHSFFVNLFGATPTNIARVVSPSNLVVTITDNNSGFSFSSPVYTVLKTGVSATITVARTDNTNQVSSVNFATADGTAQSGVDYFPTNGVLVFTNGDVSKTFTIQVIAGTTVQPDKTVLIQLFNPTNAFLIAPYAATLTIHDTTGSLVVPAGSALISENLITNGIIDPNETVTMWLGLRASGGTNIPSVFATLLPTNGVTSPSPSTQVSYGALNVGGGAVSRQFTFTASGTNNQQIAATLLINNGVTNIGTAVFTYTLGMVTNTFYNTGQIIIPTIGMASPYPSSITVSNLGGSLIKSYVTLTNFYHSYPQDVNILLVSPAGPDTMLMSHAGGSTNVGKINLTFDDAAAAYLSGTNKLTTSTNKPTQYFSTPVFP